MNQQPTVTYFFLGANSKNGFYSLYDHFANGSNDILHIIKSGPGTGKSTFMKQIGKAAEARGYDVEYILCSGDPESLDGVYIPALHTGWADGTAPHILEPKHFGIDGSYLDLGQFCQKEFILPYKDQIQTLTSAYRMCYQKAYMFLQAAGDLTLSPLVETNIESRIRSRAKAKIQKELSNTNSSGHKPTKRFLRAISCLGDHFLVHTLSALCSRICVLESNFGLEAIFFDEIITEAIRRKLFYIECPNPLHPEQTETIIFPDIGISFTSYYPSKSNEKARIIHLDSYLTEIDKSEYKQLDKFKRQLMDAAHTQLSRAKLFHDELEQYYRPALDTDGLNEYTQSAIERLFR